MTTTPVAIQVKIINKRGLHARAAAKFVKTTDSFQADVQVKRVEDGDMCSAGELVSGLSIMGLMMLAASPGTMIEIRATGPEAEQALAALTRLVQDRFNEDE